MIRLLSIFACTALAAIAQADMSSFEAFRKATAVLRHPRCMNCHIPGDQPLNGAAGEPHPMLLKRGADGQGAAVLRCSTCHQETNGEMPHSPPGAKDWKILHPKPAWPGLALTTKNCAVRFSTPN